MKLLITIFAALMLVGCVHLTQTNDRKPAPMPCENRPFPFKNIRIDTVQRDYTQSWPVHPRIISRNIIVDTLRVRVIIIDTTYR